MPKGYPPSVFVSSTCYDLNQVRADLRRFLLDLGLDPILSETPTFPVNPQTSPVDNCLRAVKERADIFVLIVGARYGSQNADGKSITNLEYLEAKAKGLPVYVFVLRGITNILPVWKNNPTGNYSTVVDTPKLFEFVEQLRTSQDHWVFEFGEVLDIINALRSQFAYLFMEGLIFRDRVKNLKLPAALSDISGKSLQLLMDRPTGWEYRLLASVMSDEMETHQGIKWDLKHGLKTKRIQKLDDALAVNEWILQKFSEIQGMIHSLDKLLNSVAQEAFGPPGVPGNPERIVYVARRITETHKSLLEWTIEFNCAEVLPQWQKLLSLISEFSSDAIAQIESLPPKIESEISKGVEAIKRGEKYTADLTLTISGALNLAEIEAEYQKISLDF